MSRQVAQWLRYAGVVILAGTGSVGCTVRPPEGVFACDEAAQCPSHWVCEARAPAVPKFCWRSHLDAGDSAPHDGSAAPADADAGDADAAPAPSDGSRGTDLRADGSVAHEAGLEASVAGPDASDDAGADASQADPDTGTNPTLPPDAGPPPAVDAGPVQPVDAGPVPPVDAGPPPPVDAGQVCSPSWFAVGSNSPLPDGVKAYASETNGIGPSGTNAEYVCRARINGSRSVGKAFMLPTIDGRACYLTYYDGSSWQHQSVDEFDVMVDPVCFAPSFVSSQQAGAFARALHFEELGFAPLHVCRMTIASAQASGTELGRVGAAPGDLCRTESFGAVYSTDAFELLINPSIVP